MSWQPPPPALLNSGWRRVIEAYLQRLIPSIPDGVQLTSWYRSPAHNARVGGATWSQHQWALATDWVGDVAPLIDAARFHGLVAVRTSYGAHIQAFPAGALQRAGVQLRA